MNWNAMNPIEWYLLILSAAAMVGAGGFFAAWRQAVEEARYWERRCRRMARREIR